MSVWALRAGRQAEADARTAVEKFFSTLAAGDLECARARASDDLSWFGRRLPWGSPGLRAWLAEAPLKLVAIRGLSSEIQLAMPQYAVLRSFGALSSTDRVLFVDVWRGEVLVTAIAVVSLAEPRRPLVTRVLDPENFVAFSDFAAVLHHLGPSPLS